MVSVWNRGNTTFTIQPGERIAQLVVVLCPWCRRVLTSLMSLIRQNAVKVVLARLAATNFLLVQV